MTTLLMVLALGGAPELPANVNVGEGYVPCRAACREHRRKARVVRPYRARLTRMAYCESTGRWHIATGNGYYGGLQFSLRSWRAVGGRGYPHWATRLEQMYRAVRLAHVQGWGAWPVCQYA